MLRSILHGFCDLVYPPNCLLCKKHIDKRSLPPSREILCLPCKESIQDNIPPFCPNCSRSLGQDFDRPRCIICAKNTHHFDFAWAACLYTDSLRKLIHQFKYNQKTSLQNYFAERIIHFITTYHFDIQQFDILIPIALSLTRMRERGYNQSQLLASRISTEFNIPVHSNILTRIRHTQPQMALRQKERWTNIQKAFTIQNSFRISNKNILLIDDLLTTGATTSEAARVLKKSGAKTVGVLTLGITV